MIERRIQSEVFLRHDVESILQAIDKANAELAAQTNDPNVVQYRAGFEAALAAVATALHIDWPEPTGRLWSVSIPEQPVRQITGGKR